jgi:hypothetical protein
MHLAECDVEIMGKDFIFIETDQIRRIGGHRGKAASEQKQGGDKSDFHGKT